MFVMKIFFRFVAITALCTPFLLARQARSIPLNWTERTTSTIGLAWDNTAQPNLSGLPLNWKTVTPLASVVIHGSSVQPSGSAFAEVPTTPDAPSADPTTRDRQNSWIVGIGGGARIGIGEPTYPLVYGRLGRMMDKNVALSLRPRYIFGNSDLQGRSNSEGAFQMPLTLDLNPTSWLSPYLGGGVVTNTDSTSKTNGMVSIGADIMFSRKLAIDLGLNYIFQSSNLDSNNGDLEFTTVLYLRF
jgi:hypothetical protein